MAHTPTITAYVSKVVYVLSKPKSNSNGGKVRLKERKVTNGRPERKILFKQNIFKLCPHVCSIKMSSSTETLQSSVPGELPFIVDNRI